MTKSDPFEIVAVAINIARHTHRSLGMQLQQVRKFTPSSPSPDVIDEQVQLGAGLGCWRREGELERCDGWGRVGVNEREIGRDTRGCVGVPERGGGVGVPERGGCVGVPERGKGLKKNIGCF